MFIQNKISHCLFTFKTLNKLGFSSLNKRKKKSFIIVKEKTEVLAFKFHQIKKYKKI